MPSNLVNPQLGQTSPQNSNMSVSMPTQSTIEASNTPQNYSCSVNSGSPTISNNNTQLETTQQPQQPQQKPVIQPPNSPSRAKKLADKFATLSPRIMKNKPDRQLIVETAYCNRNAKKDGIQSEQRPPNKAAESVKHSKKKKRSPINITEGMSRADIFAANVANAIDAAEDADEGEDYIYSNDHSRTPSLTSLSSGMPQLQTFSYPHMPSDNNYGYPYHMPPNMYGAIPNSYRSYGSYLNRAPFYGYYNSTSGSETDDVASNKLNRQNFSNPNTYKPTGVMRSTLPDMSQYVFQYKKGYPSYGSPNYPYNTYNNWYGDDERLPLFAPNYEKRQRQSCFPTMSSLTIFIVFLLASSYLIYFASTRPLMDVTITGISDVFAADKELMFNIHVEGRNYGIWNVEIVKSDLNVFATPVSSVPVGIPGGPGSHWDDVEDDTNESLSKVTPSKLGRISLFDDPLVFAAGFNRKGVVSKTTGQVRLRNPGGKNEEGQERWSYIVKSQYDLIVRGVLKYSLPFSKDRSVQVCYKTRVDGGSGSSVEDHDKLISNNNIILGTLGGACGDWEKEQDMNDMNGE